MSDHLLRDRAPISAVGWAALERDATARLTTYLAARKLVEFVGPRGWSHSATNLGRARRIPGVTDSLDAALRQVQPLVELRAHFAVSRAELEDLERGADDAQFAGLDHAAHSIATGENLAVFHGYPDAGIAGITRTAPYASMELDADLEHYPTTVARAVDVLRQAGIEGPYGLAIAPAQYTQIIETAEHGGHLLLDHLRQILAGPLVWAPGIEGGVVLSLRGGDFVFECGEDISIGYLDHDVHEVRLYLEESFTFRVLEPGAAVALAPAS